MGCCKKYGLPLFIIVLSLIGYCIHQALYSVPPVPHLSPHILWRPGCPVKSDKTIRPFKIEFNPDKIARLKERLSEIHWYTEPLEGMGFQYGFNGNHLTKIMEFWNTKYDIEARQNYLNKYPQFVTNIQGLNIHYIHVKQRNPRGKRVVPVLMIYAWPINNHKLIEKLLNPKNDADFVFSIVSPSLPGFGYSQGASIPGLGAAQMSVVVNNLMKRLGYAKYYVHGGDWGAEVGATLATLYPQTVLGLHTNLAQASSPVAIIKHLLFGFYPALHHDDDHFINKMYPLGDFFSILNRESGHIHLQTTKPDTFGIALQDSPVGLVSHILEKFSTWSNVDWSSLEDGGLEDNFDLTELLDNVMIYWDTGCITTSMRIYSETFNKQHIDLNLDRIPIVVPTAIARSAEDVLVFSKSQLKEKFHNIIKIENIHDGGHFSGFQHAERIAGEVWEAVEIIERQKNKNNIFKYFFCCCLIFNIFPFYWLRRWKLLT